MTPRHYLLPNEKSPADIRMVRAIVFAVFVTFIFAFPMGCIANLCYTAVQKSVNMEKGNLEKGNE